MRLSAPSMIASAQSVQRLRLSKAVQSGCTVRGFGDSRVAAGSKGASRSARLTLVH